MGELVTRHQLGYAVDVSDAGSLARALRDAVRTRAAWTRPDRVPAALRAEHTFEHYVPRLQAMYRNAITRRCAGGQASATV